MTSDSSRVQRLAAQLEPTDPGAVAEALATCRRSLETLAQADLQSGEMMKIRASAGAGKSTVLRDYTSGRRFLKCLYLTYNTEIADEKRQEFNAAELRHVTVKTVSAFANGPTRRAGLIDSVSSELYLAMKRQPAGCANQQFGLVQATP